MLRLIPQLLLTLALASGSAMAAGAASKAQPEAGGMDPERLDELVGEALENRIRKVAGDALEMKDVQVVVTAHTQVPPGPAYPYLPAFTSRESLLHLSNRELANFVASAEVELLLSPRLNPAARSGFEALVKRKLGRLSAKLTMSTSTLAISVEDVAKAPPGASVAPSQQAASGGASSAELANAKAAADRAAAEGRSIERERNDAKHELQLVKSQLETLGRDKSKTLEKERDEAKRQAEQAKSQSELSERELMLVKEGLELKAFLFKNASALAAISAALLGIVLFFLGVLRFGQTLAGALDGIATSLTKAPQAEGPQAAPVAEGTPAEAKEAPAAGLALGQTSLTANIESVQNRLTQLQTDLLAVIDGRAQSLVLRKITDLLKDPVKAHMAVFGLELLGKEKANAIFKKLGEEAQQQVLESLNSQDYDKPKSELMLEAGEYFKTQLMAEDFDHLATKIDTNVAEAMLKLSVEDMMEVASSLADEEIPRFFLYMGPREVAAMLQFMHRSSPTKFLRVVKLLPQIAEAEGQPAPDQAILRAISQRLAAKETDVHRPYLNFFSSIIDVAGEAIEESLVDSLSAASPSVRDYLRGQIITFATIFKINQELRDDILDAQANSILVPLLVMLPQEQAGVLRSSLSPRRLEMMEDDLKGFQDGPARAQAQQFSQAKARIVDRMKKLRELNQLTLDGPEAKLTAVA